MYYYKRKLKKSLLKLYLITLSTTTSCIRTATNDQLGSCFLGTCMVSRPGLISSVRSHRDVVKRLFWLWRTEEISFRKYICKCMLSGPWCDCLECPGQGSELHLVVLVCPFQLRIFSDSVILYKQIFSKQEMGKEHFWNTTECWTVIC